MNFAQIGNLLEAILWLSIALVLVIRSYTARSRRGLLRLAAVSFAVFGLTDLVEIQSGAWWRPTWLLVLKGICIAGVAGCLWSYVRRRSPTAGPVDP